MSKTDQRVFLTVIAGVAALGLAMKYGRDLPVVRDIADGYGA